MNYDIERDCLERAAHVRHQISEQFSHDPKKLIEYYMDLQQLYKDRLTDSETNQKDKKAA
jgi:hypothetical protein